MEYLDGCTLSDVLAEEDRLPLYWAVDIIEQVCAAVHEAHQQGIVHRDLKPDNIWLEPNRLGGYRVKVLDFGIAKLGEATAPTINEDSASTIIDDLSVLKSATPTSITDSFPVHGSVELETPTLMQPAEVSAQPIEFDGRREWNATLLCKNFRSRTIEPDRKVGKPGCRTR